MHVKAATSTASIGVMYEREKEKGKQRAASRTPATEAMPERSYLRHSVRTMELYIRRAAETAAARIQASGGGGQLARDQACQSDEGELKAAQSNARPEPCIIEIVAAATPRGEPACFLGSERLSLSSG